MHQSERAIAEENDIVERAKTNPEVFGFLYEKYYRSIFVFIDRRVEDRQTADDLTSQVFLKAMLNLPKYQFKGLPFSAWLYRIASNQINEFYRNSHQSRVVSLDDTHLERLFGEAGETAHRDRANLVRHLLDQLEPAEVQLLELRFFEDRPFKEIAYILDITENNAKVKTYRILEKLRKLLNLNEG
ncbi:MAG: sigma-70 family RNA polymerase sigma factor [Bernardetiaceae bacterium]|nr:sigma-70 family RNA polymerase sigma factor [Bernardetiaceae bacterium]